jgi:hypothetical protein
MERKSLIGSCLIVMALIAAGCGHTEKKLTAAPTSTVTPTSTSAGGGGHALTAKDIAAACASKPLQATEVGVTDTAITIQVMADTGSPLAPGFFQGDVDAVTGFADYINANGGIGCRKLKVRTWDSKFSPTEVKNGQIDACANAVALVGSNSVFNPDPTSMEHCVDITGAATGLPDIAAFTTDANEMCSRVTIGVNTRSEGCPVATGQARDFARVVGPTAKLLQMHPGLHGVYLANRDLPSTKVAAIPDIAAQTKVGVTFDATLTQSARDEQTAFTPRVQYLKQGANFVSDGSSDAALVLYMKEAIAQAVDTTKVVWSCGVACYTQKLLSSGGSAVDGAYVWVPFLPLEEKDTNPALNAFVTTVGKKVDTWGVVSWQAAIAFQQVVNQIVVDKGPNAITRANILAGLKDVKDFTADGISGPRTLSSPSPCFVLLQVKHGAFNRVWPKERGSLDCNPSNLATVHVNQEQEAAKLG